MNNVISDQLDAFLKKTGSSLGELERIYPKMHESLMPLSISNVSARTFNHWKKSGLIPVSIQNEQNRGWVRINLIEFVWLKLIQIMRDFGVSLDVIKQAKEILFTNVLTILFEDKEPFFRFLESHSDYSKEKIDELNSLFQSIGKEINNSVEEYGIHTTLLGSLIANLLLYKDSTSIVLTKEKNKFKVGYFSYKTMEDFQKIVYPLLELPHIQIPIKQLIEDFFDDPKSERYVGSFELLSLKEKKVIQAIRQKDFKEIIIKQDSKDEPIIIEIVKDGAIMDQRAREVKRILGLNEYSEVTIKYRNDKHLYFKNKTRL